MYFEIKKWVWNFFQKGLFWVYKRHRGFFGSQKKHTEFSGYCTFHQLKSTIIYCWCGIFWGMLFLGKQVLKLEYFWVYNMNICWSHPPPPIIKISEWGLWDMDKLYTNPQLVILTRRTLLDKCTIICCNVAMVRILIKNEKQNITILGGFLGTM